jgi:hypothetical protein
MGDVSEIQQAKAWLYDVLHDETGIEAQVGTRIYADYAPETPSDRTYPYILFNYMGGVDVDGLGTARIFSEPLFQVRVVFDSRPDDDARLLEKRIDDVLQVAMYQPSGDYYFTSRREQPIDRTEIDPSTGKRYHNLGGLYRLWIGATI